MPSGYTAEIEKGISFERFALNCSRAFGALISMRDDPMDTPIPDKIEPSDYHFKEWQRARKDYELAKKITLKNAKELAKNDYENAVKYNKKSIAEKNALKIKYEQMLSKVMKWVPPSKDHVAFKDFMIDQIKKSIDWDCDTKYNKDPVLKSAKEWLKEKIERNKNDIEYHFKNHKEELERCANRTKWIQDLKNSLNV
jgi:hypothetical protein